MAERVSELEASVRDLEAALGAAREEIRGLEQQKKEHLTGRRNEVWEPSPRLHSGGPHPAIERRPVVDPRPMADPGASAAAHGWPDGRQSRGATGRGTRERESVASDGSPAGRVPSGALDSALARAEGVVTKEGRERRGVERAGSGVWGEGRSKGMMERMEEEREALMAKVRWREGGGGVERRGRKV